jgi:hypothetical protein
MITKTAALLAVAAFAVTGCKTGTDANNFINHIKLSKDTQTFEYSTTFGQNVEVDMEAEIPVGKYGSISFYKDDNGQFNVALKASFDVFSDISLNPVTTLPNGMSFPSIVSGPLNQLKVADVSGQYSVYAYFDNPASTGTKKLVGLAIQFENIKNNLPQVTITQSFFTQANQKFASFTIFGPTTKNGVTIPGGIFLIGDVNQAIDSSDFNTNSMKVAGPEAHKYQSEHSKTLLMWQVKKALEANGINYKGN